MEVKDRLKKYIDSKCISQNAFCKAIGVSGAYIASIRKSISPEKISSIAKEFPDLNLTWLLTGNGDMLLDKTDTPTNITAENSIVGDGNTHNHIEAKDDAFWKDLVTDLRATIADLRKRCGTLEEANSNLEKALEEEKSKNPLHYVCDR